MYPWNKLKKTYFKLQSYLSGINEIKSRSDFNTQLCTQDYPPAQWKRVLGSQGLREINYVSDEHTMESGLSYYAPAQCW